MKVGPETYTRTLTETIPHSQATRCATPPTTVAAFLALLDGGYDEAPACARQDSTDRRQWIPCQWCGNLRRLVINQPSERTEAERRPCMACANQHRHQGKTT
jgi:hypothetical protein